MFATTKTIALVLTALCALTDVQASGPIRKGRELEVSIKAGKGVRLCEGRKEAIDRSPNASTPTALTLEKEKLDFVVWTPKEKTGAECTISGKSTAAQTFDFNATDDGEVRLDKCNKHDGVEIVCTKIVGGGRVVCG